MVHTSLVSFEIMFVTVCKFPSLMLYKIAVFHYSYYSSNLGNYSAEYEYQKIGEYSSIRVLEYSSSHA